MRRLLSILFLAFFCVLFFQPDITEAAIETVTADGRYVMGDHDTRDTAKKEAHKEAIRYATEQAGIYVSSYSKTNNLVLTEDEVEVVAGNLIKVTDESYKFEVSHEKWVCIATVTASFDTDNLSPDRIMELKMSKFLKNYEEKYLKEKAEEQAREEKQKLEQERRAIAEEKQKLIADKKRYAAEYTGEVPNKTPTSATKSDTKQPEYNTSRKASSSPAPQTPYGNSIENGPSIDVMRGGYTGIILDARSLRKDVVLPINPGIETRIFGADGTVVYTAASLTKEEVHWRGQSPYGMMYTLRGLHDPLRRSGGNPLFIKLIDAFIDWGGDRVLTLYVSTDDAAKLRRLESEKHFIHDYKVDIYPNK